MRLALTLVVGIAVIIGLFYVISSLIQINQENAALFEARQARIANDPAFALTEFERMYVVSDPLTGCQYLTTYNRSFTPRLNASGQPICQPPR